MGAVRRTKPKRPVATNQQGEGPQGRQNIKNQETFQTLSQHLSNLDSKCFPPKAPEGAVSIRASLSKIASHGSRPKHRLGLFFTLAHRNRSDFCDCDAHR